MGRARVHLAISSPVHTARELAHGLHEAERALEVTRRLDVADRPLAFEHLGVYRVLLGGGGSRHRHAFVADALGQLRRYDAAVCEPVDQDAEMGRSGHRSAPTRSRPG